ncbi:MFS transporter [Halomarina pelagica]|uniref:MFS transporter n=1 Tax=Halomarina pelagica TaxID=2961599 RepID=UPI0020C30C6D|nr:MFS transporter [Halomarina sp. BND7]
MSRSQLFGSLCAMVFLVNLARVIYAPLLVPLQQTFDVTEATLGLITALAWFGSASPRFPAGYLLTKTSRMAVVVGSGIVLTGSALLAAAAPSIEVIMVGAFCMGLASGPYFIAAGPLLSELFPGRVGRVLGVHGAASQFAAVGAAPFVLVVLAFGSWRATFAVIAALTAAVTVVLALVGRRADLPDAGAADRDLLGAARAQWRIILAGIAFVSLTGLVWNGVFNFYVIYMIQAKSLSEPMANALLTVLFAAGIPAFVVGGDFAERLPTVPFVIGISVAFALSLLALATVTGLLAVVAVTAVVGFVVHCLFPAVDTYILGSVPDEHRASTYAAFSGTVMLPQAIGSVAFGVVRTAGVGWDALARWSALGLLLAMGVLVGLYADGRLPSAGVPAER